MKATDELQRMAARMLADYDALTPGELFARPFDLSIARAYELQAAITRLREERGETVIGYKVGCTSATIQKQLGVNEPIFGRLFDTGCYASGARIACQCYANLAVEGELALLLGKALAGPSLTIAECADAVAAVLPVIELHNYVLHDAPSQAPELIASNGMHAGFVIRKEPAGSSPLNLARGISLQINDVQVGAVEGPRTLEPSLESLRWLVRRLAEFGLGLREGQIILAGAALPLFPVGPGDTIVVEAPPFGTSRAELGP